MNLYREIQESKSLKLSLLLHILIPLFSLGFLHPDEYYYVLDFTFHKLGLLENYRTSWEYNSQIRPWFLPGVLYVLGTPLKFLGFTNVFFFTAFFQLISSLFALFSHLFFLKKVKERYQNLNLKHLPWMLLLAWPILLMHARTNSENWSSSFFLLSLALSFKAKRPFLIGALFALAFFTRFQVALLICPLIFLYKHSFKNILKTSLAFLLSSMVLISIDFWGYGQWTLTPYNYFHKNIVEGVVNTFGTHSIFYYSYKALTTMIPFWGLLSIFIFFYALTKIRREKIYLEYIILISLFTIVHHSIGHKELRFIYTCFPLLLVPLSHFLSKLSPKKIRFLKISNAIIIPFLFIPLYKPMLIYRYIYNHSKQIKEITYLREHYSPFELQSFSSSKVKATRYDENSPSRFVLTQNYNELKKVTSKRQCEFLISTYPEFFIKKNPYNVLKRSSIWVVLDCK